MKWLEVSEEIFLRNSERAEVAQMDGSCFGFDIDRKFYLYVNNGEKYILDIFNRTLQEILEDDVFFECMAIRFVDAEKHVTDLLHWHDAGSKLEDIPFMLDDIHYSDYDG